MFFKARGGPKSFSASGPIQPWTRPWSQVEAPSIIRSGHFNSSLDGAVLRWLSRHGDSGAGSGGVERNPAVWRHGRKMERDSAHTSYVRLHWLLDVLDTYITALIGPLACQLTRWRGVDVISSVNQGNPSVFHFRSGADGRPLFFCSSGEEKKKESS